MKTTLPLLLAALFGLGGAAARAQSVGVGTANPHSSAALDVQATNKGLLPPRLTAAQRAAISSPAAGLLVYQTDGTPGYFYYNGSVWLDLRTGLPPGTDGTLPRPASYGQVSTLPLTALDSPNGVAVDAGGKLYVTDSFNRRIRVITPDGQMSTLAGSGATGAADGPAATATFGSIQGIAVDGQGRVYVADSGNRRIRLIENGQVSTFAGTGTAGSADGPAANAQFRSPYGVAVDGQGRVYVADAVNHKIRLIQNGQVSTLAGTGAAGNGDGPVATAQFNLPYGVAVDEQGRVYVADSGNDKIRLVQNGQVSTLAGSGTSGFADGPALTAQFSVPYGLAVDGHGRVYVADAFNYKIRLIQNGQVSTLAGSGGIGLADGPGATAQFNLPYAVAVDQNGTVYVADQNNDRIRRVGGVRTELLQLSGQTLSLGTGNTVTLPAGADNLGNHTATQALGFSTNDADKILFTQAAGASGSKLEHAAGWLLNYYAGPNNATAGTHRFLTGTGSGWQERLRIDDPGNVGIGTDNPQRALDVNGSIRQQTYSSGVITLGATSVGAFDWTHNLGYQPTLMLSVDQTGGDGGEYIIASYQHLDNNTVRFRLRNVRSAPGTFRVRWIRVD